MLKTRSLSHPERDGVRALRLPNGTYTWFFDGRWLDSLEFGDALQYTGISEEALAAAGYTLAAADVEGLTDEEIFLLCDARGQREREDVISLMRAARLRPEASPLAARPRWLALSSCRIRLDGIQNIEVDGLLVRIWADRGRPAILEFPTAEEARSEYDRITDLLGE